ncbi:MAG TPA: diguanylate cyclase [Desulfatirhabdiaceae bacterium]|nr:diguanylate cyclase [Desulfatirhabdiaceae bacterium]
MSTSVLTPVVEDTPDRSDSEIDNTILVVDDDASVRSSMTDFFRISGYPCFMASNAEDALDILKGQNIQIVITDIMMPGMDGLELTDLIKKYFDIDVMVMTGFGGDYSYELAIGKGASDFVIKPIRYPELLLRVNRVIRERKTRAERDRIMERLQLMAITDELTRLFNSRHFYHQLKLEIERSSRYHYPLSLLMMDIDYFKNYNDHYGHIEGDRALAKIGQLIKLCLRAMDSAYRYGGEEFIAILPSTSGVEAGIVANRIRSAVEAEEFVIDTKMIVHMSLSIGITDYLSGEEMTDLVYRADKAMYQSKENGRNKVSFIPAGASF